ncbi:HVO_2922 family protein [Halomarina oriensis]|uniref:DUF1508 domain-containing protein n=1 Tax=Halomarina oriensis TaxID=671145 RepID=A0A6B0GNH1_9EURY|nr:DUF1508 domain-containing protein [Halomarina oriensis]
MNPTNRPVATLTVSVDDATLSVTTSESKPVGTELLGPDVAGELRLRVDTHRTSTDRPDTDRQTDPPEGHEPTADDSVRADSGAPETASSARFEVYEDRAGEYRWRLVHDNGNLIADSGEGYATWQGAENGLRSVKANAPNASVERL